MRWPDLALSAPGFALLATFVAGTLSAAPDQNTSSTSPVAASPAVSQKLDLPVPVGEPVKGIKIPQYDETGKMTMCLMAETAQKLNEHQVDLGRLKVQFDEKANKEIVVEIPHSILDLETKVLTADSETKIKREDFEIIGESAVFDTLSRQGSFKGHVHASFLNDTAMETSVIPPIATPAKP